MFTILGWIMFGLIVGVIAKLMMPGRDLGGIIVTILLGFAGALLGGILGRAMGLYGPGEASGFVMSVIGAIVLLGALSPARRPSHLGHPYRGNVGAVGTKPNDRSDQERLVVACRTGIIGSGISTGAR
jgi:uncharacterized membrane protein YeaQ/YmgE (transglycosylase-associated protein family)